MSLLAPTLQGFFADRLIRQRQASPHTVAAYRDALRLLITFTTDRLHIEPSLLHVDHLDARLVTEFLDHLEHSRKASVRTRNARLAAIRSLFRFAAFRHPEHAAVIERILAIPPKRLERNLVAFLTEAEVTGLVLRSVAFRRTVGGVPMKALNSIGHRKANPQGPGDRRRAGVRPLTLRPSTDHARRGAEAQRDRVARHAVGWRADAGLGSGDVSIEFVG
jgi:Phage integrase, N-terminal SAM-like domain